MRIYRFESVSPERTTAPFCPQIPFHRYRGFLPLGGRLAARAHAHTNQKGTAQKIKQFLFCAVLRFAQLGLSGSLRLPRQLFCPLEAVALDGGGCAFENLVAVQAEQHDCGIPLEHKRAKEGHGQHDAPDADKVVDKDKFGVPAAAYDADVDRHLVRRAHARDAEHQQKVFCHVVGLGGEIVEIQNEGANDKQRNPRDQADAKENELKGSDVLAQLLHVALAHRFADDDGSCRSRAHRHDLEQLEHGTCN